MEPKNDDRKKPLVSIVTVVFNGEKFLEDTLKSVITQNYANIEYIVVDGGSTDQTLAIIERYRDRISKFISEPDEGISDAMNKGIRMSSGAIIGIIHSDDYYADNTVIGNVVDAFARDDKIKAVYGVQDYIDPATGRTLLTWGRETAPSEIKKRMYIPHPTLFVRREVYDEIGDFRKDYRVAMDYEFAIRLTKYTTPSFLNYKIARMRDAGASGRQSNNALKESVRALFAHGYYFSSLTTALRNITKQLLIWLGLKKLLYALWERNVSPR